MDTGVGGDMDYLDQQVRSIGEGMAVPEGAIRTMQSATKAIFKMLDATTLVVTAVHKCADRRDEIMAKITVLMVHEFLLPNKELMIEDSDEFFSKLTLYFRDAGEKILGVRK